MPDIRADKLYPAEYELAFAEAAGAFIGAHYGRGETPPRMTPTLKAALEGAAEVAFNAGYITARLDAPDGSEA